MPTEKRRTPRKAVAVPASLARQYAGSREPPVRVRTLNLSTGGALIESLDRLYRGEYCAFSFDTGRGRADIQARIVWTDSDSDGACRAGIAFRSLSPDQQYIVELHMVGLGTSIEPHNLERPKYAVSAEPVNSVSPPLGTSAANAGAWASPPADSDKRHLPRQLLVVPASVALDSRQSAFPLLVHTLNLSREGALIESREPLAPGETCAFAFETGRADGLVPARIVWTQNNYGTYRSGVVFRNLTPDEQYIVDVHLTAADKQLKKGTRGPAVG